MNTLEGHPVTDDAALLASPEVSADKACETALDALDQLMVLLNKDDTFQTVIANKIFVGLIARRTNTLVGQLMAKSAARHVA